MRVIRGYGARALLRNLAFSVGLSVSAVSAEPIRIAALGDSLTQGYGLVPDDGFVSQLAARVAGDGVDVEFINAGVSGDTTAGGLARIDWTLSDDVDALIVALGGNDVLRGIDPSTARENLDGILTRADGVPVLLVGITVPPNYGPEYQAAFEAIYPDLAEIHGTLYYPDFLAALTRAGDRATVIETYMQGDAIHPNAAGVTLIVEDMMPKVLELIALADQHS